MTITPRDLLYAGSHVLSHDDYLALCTVRDKLLLMAQLTGSSASLSDANAMLFVRRALLGELFGELSFQLKDVLKAVEEGEAPRAGTTKQ